MKNKVLFVIVVLLIVFVGILIYYKFKDKEINNVSGLDSNVETDNSYENIDWSKYIEEDILLSDSLEIKKGGIYRLSGELKNGYVKVDVDDYVKLILNGVKINNESGPSIIVNEAKTVVIHLEEDSVNEVSDGVNYVGYDEDVKGAIYSKDDLVLEGSGVLNVKANYKDGIVCKDDLKIISGTYNIESEDDGMRGKDSVYIMDGTFNIKSLGDAIKSTNDTDKYKGFIKISGGLFNIESELDGIEAETKLVIDDGTFNIRTGGGSENSSTQDTWGMWGKNSSENEKSAKGLKASENIIINGGVFNLDTSDDSIHSNSNIGIVNGTYVISSGDDGIHADNELIIDGGNISVNKSYEGLESANMTINNGVISVVSSDDGINVAGGMDKSSMDRRGTNGYQVRTSNKLTINDGTIYVNASGDGIDDNGSIYVYGGYITVDGPTNNGNGALDYDSEFIMDGGVLIAVGYSGMSQSISDKSKQNNLMMNLDKIYDGAINLIDSEDNVIEMFTPSKEYNSIVISTPRFEKNSEYRIEIDGEIVDEFKITSTTTFVGGSGGFNQPRNEGRGPDRPR